MQKFITYLFGYAVIRITGDAPLDYVNRMLREGVYFFKLENISAGELELRVFIRALKSSVLDRIASQSGQSYEIRRKSGLFYKLSEYKSRSGLAAGFIAGLLLIYASTLFIWDVRIADGVLPPSQSELVLARLAMLGCRPGVLRADIDTLALENSIILAEPSLGWAAVNLIGTVAYVELRFADPPVNIIDEDAPINIVASRPGVVLNVDTYQGQEVVRPGDAPQRGDLLIRGGMDSQAIGMRITRAMGEVWARTTRDLYIYVPLIINEKVYTGHEEKFNSLNILGKTINFYIFNRTKFTEYDKIVTDEIVVLFERIRLPIRRRITILREYVTQDSRLTEVQAAERARLKLDMFLEDNPELPIVSKEVTYLIIDGVYILHCRIECIEDIGQEMPFEVKLEPVLP
jgi:similar to stage IV sporulation protein